MKVVIKKFTALFCALSLFAACTLCGCGNETKTPLLSDNTPAEAEVLQPEAAKGSEVVSDNTDKAPDTAEVPTVQTSGELTLDNVSYKQMATARFTMDDSVSNILCGTRGFWNITSTSYSTPQSLLCKSSSIFARRSSRQLGENAPKAAKQLKYDTVITTHVLPTANVESITEGDPINIKLGSVSVSHSIYDITGARGFIRRISNGKAECVIDPAFMRGIPMFSSEEKYMTFNINGRTIFSDSLSFDANADYTELDSVLGTDNYDYVYAMFDIEYISINFDTESGYSNSGNISGIKLLTRSTDDVIDSRYLFGSDVNADAANDAEMLYDLLSENYAAVCGDTAVGLNLLDMDKDGSPELIVTRLDKEYEARSRSALDVDVYGIYGQELKFIGTIENITQYSTFTDTETPYLYLKKTGSPTERYEWLALTRDDDSEQSYTEWRAELYRVENKELKSRELFCFTSDENGGSLTINGAPVEIKEETDESGNVRRFIDTDCGSIDVSYPNYFLDYYIVCLFYLNKFCADIDEKQFLYSDWLSPSSVGSDGTVYISNDTLSPSDRDIKLNLGQLADKYFSKRESNDRFVYFEMPGGGAMKPVIYLYPEEETEVSVSLAFPNGGNLTCVYPEYEKDNNAGWQVTASPDGTLYDSDGSEYYCLYWEAEGLPIGGSSEKAGFCVSGGDTAEFLREKLLYIGLTPREANEFIIYWLPQMQKNPYNIITFHTDDYAAAAPLAVSPAPDTSIRVFMTFTPSDTPVDIPPQQLPHYTRSGFTLVEWGGGER